MCICSTCGNLSRGDCTKYGHYGAGERREKANSPSEMYNSTATAAWDLSHGGSNCERHKRMMARRLEEVHKKTSKDNKQNTVQPPPAGTYKDASLLTKNAIFSAATRSIPAGPFAGAIELMRDEHNAQRARMILIQVGNNEQNSMATTQHLLKSPPPYRPTTTIRTYADE